MSTRFANGVMLEYYETSDGEFLQLTFGTRFSPDELPDFLDPIVLPISVLEVLYNDLVELKIELKDRPETPAATKRAKRGDPCQCPACIAKRRSAN